MRQVPRAEAQIGDTALLWKEKQNVIIKDEKTKLEVRADDKYFRFVWRLTRAEKMEWTD